MGIWDRAFGIFVSEKDLERRRLGTEEALDYGVGPGRKELWVGRRLGTEEALDYGKEARDRGSVGLWVGPGKKPTRDRGSAGLWVFFIFGTRRQICCSCSRRRVDIMHSDD